MPMAICRISIGTVTDAMLMKKVSTDSADSSPSETKKPLVASIEGLPAERKIDGKPKRNPFTDEERNLMRDILNHPLDGVVGRYSRLRISRRRGNAARQSLIKRGALQAVGLSTRTGKIVLLEPTTEMKQSLERHGVAHFSNRDGGVAHQYWRKKLADAFTSAGWKTTLEKAVGGGQKVDVEAVSGSARVAIEIEAGSRGVLNIKKAINAGYTQVMSFSVDGFSRKQVENAVLENRVSGDGLILASPTDYEKHIQRLSRKFSIKP